MSKTKDILPKQGYPAELEQFMNKRVMMILNGNRRIIGKVQGHDHFMNITLTDTVEYVGKDGVETRPLFWTVVRGESIIFWECLEKVESKQITK
jgi:small nuclear ribonucleoprotein G